MSFAILLIAVAFDLRNRQIPDTLSVCLLALAILSTALHLHRVGWLDLTLGFAAGLLFGLILFALGALGGGDVKLLAALGAVAGLRDVLGVMLYTALVGAVLAAVAHVRRQRDYAYAPAIAFGLLCFILRGYLP